MYGNTLVCAVPLFTLISATVVKLQYGDESDTFAGTHT